MISLIHPSRGRPDKSFENAIEWIEKAGVSTELIVSIDYDDPLKIDYRTKYFDYPCIFLVNDNKSVVQATNEAAKVARGSILVYLSDDFKCFDNWGVAVKKEFEGVSHPLLLKVHDDLQNFYARVCTIPIMNRQLYEKLGYFWHPEYKSMWVDCDLFETCTKLAVIKNAPNLVFPHMHYSNGKCEVDEIYRASESNWNQGLEVFNRRKLQGFTV